MKMTERWENESLEHLLRRRMDYLRKRMEGTVGEMLEIFLTDVDEANNIFTFEAKPEQWMINFHGTIHGGICATYVDQAMGLMALCLKPGPGICPTVDMNVKYHRPMVPTDKILMKVRLVSQTKRLIYLSCEAFHVSAPDKVCVSATATYFYKPEGTHL